MLGRVLSVLTGSSRRSRSADQSRTTPTTQCQAVVPCRQGGVQGPGVAEGRAQSLRSSIDFGFSTIYHSQFPLTTCSAQDLLDFAQDTYQPLQEAEPANLEAAVVEIKRLQARLNAALHALQLSRQEHDYLAQQLHQRRCEWETERTQLRQRLDWSETLLAAERQRLLKADGDVTLLRRRFAELQQERTSCATELALAQRALQNLRAERQNWLKAAKQLEGLTAVKEEAERYKGAVRRLTADTQELRNVREQLRESEKARQALANQLLKRRAEAQTCAALLQKAAHLEVHLADAKDLIAELKARVSELESGKKGKTVKNLTKNSNTSCEESAMSPSISPNHHHRDEAAPTIYYNLVDDDNETMPNETQEPTQQTVHRGMQLRSRLLDPPQQGREQNHRRGTENPASNSPEQHHLPHPPPTRRRRETSQSPPPPGRGHRRRSLLRGGTMAVLATTLRGTANTEDEDSEASEASQKNKNNKTTRREQPATKTTSPQASPTNQQERRSRSSSPQRDLYSLMLQMMQKLDSKIEDLRREISSNKQPSDIDSRLTSSVEGTSTSSVYNTPSESANPLGTHTRRVCIAAAPPVLPAPAETLLNIDPLSRARYAYLSDFKGEDGRQWINLMEGHFMHARVAEEHKFDVAVRYFAGNVMCDWQARGETYARTWDGIKQFIAEWYDPVTVSSVRERLAKVKWEGCVQKLQNDIIRAVGMCADFTEEQLINNFVGRLPKRLQYKYGTEVAKMKTFQEVVAYFKQQDHLDKELARVNLEVHTQANYANFLKEEREGERQRKVTTSNKTGRKGSRVVMLTKGHGGGTYPEGEIHKTEEPKPVFKLGPCRHCKGRGHFSQTCANLKGTNAPKDTICFECKGTGHYGRECANKRNGEQQGQAKQGTNNRTNESVPQGNGQA